MDALMGQAQKKKEKINSWRQYLHQYPEIGFDLPKTTSFIAYRLKEMPIQVKEKVGHSGVVGLLKGKNPGKTFAIRADMDALKVTEETGLTFSSQHPGKMHACGHDGHSAIALGAAELLSDLREKINGQIKFIFQPGEEGFDGARAMIADGVLDDPPVDVIMGLHLGVFWDIPSGYVGVKDGAVFSASDIFEFSIMGRGGHGAIPQKTPDPVAIGSQIISTMQQIVSRKVNPFDPVVISFCTFNSGSAPNVIAKEAKITGTVRTLNEKTRENMPSQMEKIIAGITSSFGAEYEFNYKFGYPPVINNKEITCFFSENTKKLIGPEKVVRLKNPTMVGEDMAYFLKEVPGTFFALASGTESKGTHYPNHSGRFDIDEEVLPLGSAILANAAYEWLNNN